VREQEQEQEELGTDPLVAQTIKDTLLASNHHIQIPKKKASNQHVSGNKIVIMKNELEVNAFSSTMFFSPKFWSIILKDNFRNKY